MTLSLGAELTASSFIITISSPGISFPSEGPPVVHTHTKVFSIKHSDQEIQTFMCISKDVYECRRHIPGVTERTTTGFSLPATKPKPSTGSRLISTLRGGGGTNFSTSIRTSSKELDCDRWLTQRQSYIHDTQSHLNNSKHHSQNWAIQALLLMHIPTSYCNFTSETIFSHCKSRQNVLFTHAQ